MARVVRDVPCHLHGFGQSWLIRIVRDVLCHCMVLVGMTGAVADPNIAGLAKVVARRW